MIFENFKIAATPFIHDATCKNCHASLIEVRNGFLSKAMYCPDCENVYVLKLVKVPISKVTDEFLEQCRKEVKRDK